MRRPLLSLIAIVLLGLLVCDAGVGQSTTSNRADEWKSYELPTTDFVRHADEQGIIFRRPASWQPEANPDKTGKVTTYRFTAPYGAKLSISVEKISDGLPLPEYTAAILQQLRNLPEIGDSLAVRSTEMSGLEAREIAFVVHDENDEPSHRLIWCAVSGPVALAVVFIAPENRRAELEPYLRGVLDTLILAEPLRIKTFETLRSAVIKESKPARVDEVQSIFSTINGLDAQARDTAIRKLTTTFATTPDRAIDYLLDRRPLLRAATLQAIGASQNHTLDRLLLHGLRDKEDYVAQRAGASIATLPNALALMREETLNWLSTPLLARVWPFLPKKSQVQIASEVFAPSAKSSTKSANRSSVRIVGVDLPPDPNSQLGLLTLLVDMQVQDFKLPFDEVLKTKTSLVIVAALHVAVTRGENLPAAELIKLLSSPNNEVRRMAALNLGESGTTADISVLEELVDRVNRSSAPASEKVSTASPNDEKTRGYIQLAIKKIRLRHQLAAVNAEQKQKLLSDALADAELTEWTWLRHIRDEKRAAMPALAARLSPPSALGENVFPEKMTHYVALQNPAEAVHKFSESLNNIQLDSARGQANLVLVLNSMRRQLGSIVSTPAGGSIADYSGIGTTSPIAFGSWIETGAPTGINLAQRKAVVLRVGDRDRFEHSLALYQEKIGSFASLPDGVAIGARFLGAAPAILPLTAEALLQEKPDKKKDQSVLSFGFQGVTVVDGLPIKWFSKRRVSSEGIITNDVAFLYYAGDTAVLTPDIASMREVLRRLGGVGPFISNNPQFQKARETKGEAIYFSDLSEVFSQPGVKLESKITETGALGVSNNSWESSYRLNFSNQNWYKPIRNFQPAELSAPRDLLPRSTVLYYFMNVDAGEFLRQWSAAVEGPEKMSLAALMAGDFEKDVLPELDSEIGAALLGFPDFNAGDSKVPWLVFVKLKSDKLKDALAQNRLLKNAQFDKGVTKFRFGTTDLSLTIQNGFLLLYDAPRTLELIDQQDKLIASPDFAKAVKRTPTSVGAFGGYNLAAAAPPNREGVDSVVVRQADMLLSLLRAFHSPSLYATINSGNLEAYSSVSLDREGRYSVAELQTLSANSEPRFAITEPTGLPITDQNRIKSLKLRIHAKASGEVDRLVEDLSSHSQRAEKKSEKALQLEVLPRRADPKQKFELPIRSAEMTPYLARNNGSDDKTVGDKAREIAGDDRDAWSVARKLADWTYKNLTWKRVDDADAAQTLASREADCYEFSKLYVAMARSLGLPARIVSGMAYSGGAFGGHAWVEVYAGNWIEIDPTWGTNFVDATHIKDSNGALLTYAALNLIQLEILEAPRGMADFQASPDALVKKLNEELIEGRIEALQAALDLVIVTDQLMGAGSWAGMSDIERAKISGAHRQTINGISEWLKKDSEYGDSLRLLKLNVTGDRAEALCMHQESFEEMLLKFVFVRDGDAWFLTEISQADSALKFISESLQPTVQRILAQRKNENVNRMPSQTNFVRVLVTMRTNAPAALPLADRFLKDNPQDRNLRFAKSLALSNAEKEAEAVSLWTELAENPPPMAPALLNLAMHFASSKEESDKKKAIDWYVRYIAVEPDDPRARSNLASLYEYLEDFARAEHEYRAAVERDSSNSLVYLDLAEFYATRKRFNEAFAVINDAARRTTDTSDLFADLIGRFWSDEQIAIADGLAASQPDRMDKSAGANLALGRLRFRQDARAALPLFKKASLLDPKSSEPHEAMAEAYRQLHLWGAALHAANTAIRLNKDDAGAHYERACALARLGRKAEALTALRRAIELDEELQEYLADEDDLEPLASLPEFKKLLPPVDQP